MHKHCSIRKLHQEIKIQRIYSHWRMARVAQLPLIESLLTTRLNLLEKSCTPQNDTRTHG
jgi:hypothetical protein